MHSGLQLSPVNLSARGARHRTTASRRPSGPRSKSQRQPRGRTKQRVAPKTTVTPVEAPKKNGAKGAGDEDRVGSRSPSPRSRVKAIAAKISAARELARRLADEKQAAVAEGVIDNERARKHAAEAARAAAIQAAQADAMARAVAKAQKGSAKDLAAEQLKAKAKALQALVLEIAEDPEEAKSRLQEIDKKFAKMSSYDLKDSTDATPSAAFGVEEEESMQEANAMAEVEVEVVEEESIEGEEDPDLLLHQECAKRAHAEGLRVFTVPEGPVVLGKSVRVFYNRASGPLPGDAALKMKYGTNRWESSSEAIMQQGPPMDTPESEWWVAKLRLSKDTFRCDFVVEDMNSRFVDNNTSMDFQLELKDCPTEAQVMEERLVAMEKNEQQRELEVEQEARKYRKDIAAAMESAAQAAQAKFKTQRLDELRKLAKDSIVGRRAQAVKALMTAGNEAGNIFKWSGEVQHSTHNFLVYNKIHGPLSGAADVKIHLGTDNWWQMGKEVLNMSPVPSEELKVLGLSNSPQHTEWVGVLVDVPKHVAVLDFVFSDAKEEMWDNNNGQDFHTAIENPLSNDELVVAAFEAMRAETAANDKDLEDRIGKAAARKLEVKAESYLVRHQAQSKFLYTRPLTPKAGEKVEVFYRPELTELRGRPEVYIRGSFNKWHHAQCFMPTKMEPTLKGGVGFLKTTIQVPKDAHFIDLVFSDTGDQHGGFFDNNGGLDYHIPVAGAEGQLKPLHVVHVTVEMAPIAKVGGLADVVTALGRAVQDEGHHVEAIIPKYDVLDYDQVVGLEKARGFHFGGAFVEAWKGKVEGLEVTFLEPDNGMFWVGCIYGRKDDYDRFAFFCGAALEYMKIFNINSDVIHCHDWQTAAVAFGDRARSKCVFTIHNLNYGADLIGRAIESCNVATTVSPTYATEVSGNPAVAPHLSKFFGIRNGIDVDIWDPALDKMLPCNYTEDNVGEAKSIVKRALREKMGLEELDVPIVGVVTRLTPQKGIHLIRHAAWRTLERGGQFVLLGSAPDPAIQADFDALAVDLASQYPNRVKLWFEYNEPLSHLIYAGCDIFLVPSMFEPCGLTQMIAMRYGTIPVVRKTGGLSDTVFDIDDDEEKAANAGMITNGFVFEGVDGGSMDYGLNRAISYYYNDSDGWKSLVERAMKQDWSWGVPGNDYIDLYFKAMK